MMAAGVSFFRIVTPLILFGILMWIIMLLATELIVRPVNKLAKIEHDTLTEGMGTLANSVYQFHVKGKEGFYYLYFYDPDKDEINGGFNYIRLRPDGSPETVISSLKAKYNYETKLWKMKKVEEWHFDNDLKLSSQETYEEKEYELPEEPSYFKVPAGSVEEMNLFQLKEEEKRRIQKRSCLRRCSYRKTFRFCFTYDDDHSYFDWNDCGVFYKKNRRSRFFRNNYRSRTHLLYI